MSRVIRHRVAAALVGLTLTVAGCGVGSEDRPQPIEDTSIPRLPATPSVDVESGPPSTTPTTPTISSPTPPP